jgi:hypothetical protein
MDGTAAKQGPWSFYMIWDEARLDGKVKEKWGKAYPDEASARRMQDYQDHRNAMRFDGGRGEADSRESAA